MQLRFLVPMAGVDFTRNIGDVADVEAAEAGRLIAAGYAVPVVEEPKQDRAVKVRPAAEKRG